MALRFTLSQRWRIWASACLGAGAGVILLTAEFTWVTCVFMMALNPAGYVRTYFPLSLLREWRDWWWLGPWALDSDGILVPLAGASLGALCARGLLLHRTSPLRAGRPCLIVGGLLAVALAIRCDIRFSELLGYPSPWVSTRLNLTSDILYCVLDPALICSVALMWWGFSLCKQSRGTDGRAAQAA